MGHIDQAAGIAIIVAAAIALVAILIVVARERNDAEAAMENPFAVSTEGQKRCPHCGMGNLWTDATCVSCGAKLAG